MLPKAVPRASPFSRWAPAAVFLLALAVRLVFLGAHPRPLHSDEIDYDRLGWTLANTGRYAEGGHPTAYRPVGYPAVIAAVYALAGRSPDMVKVVQAVLDSGTALLLVILFGRRNRAAGLLAGLTWALLPASVLFSSQLFAECVLVFALTLFVLVVDSESHSKARSVGAGLLLGGMILLRPNVAGLFAAAIPFALHRSRRTLILALALLPVGLWMLRNALVLGAPVLTTSMGVNLFIGNHTRATGSYAPIDPAVAPPSGRTELEADAAAGRAAVEEIRREPGRALIRAGKKVLFLLTSEGELVVGHFAGSSTEGKRYGERFRSVSPWLHFLVSLPSALVMVLGTLALATRRAEVRERLFYALLLATVVSCVIFFGGSRFRFPLMALLVGFAAELVMGRSKPPGDRKLGLLAAWVIVSLCLAVWAGEWAVLAAPH